MFRQNLHQLRYLPRLVPPQRLLARGTEKQLLTLHSSKIEIAIMAKAHVVQSVLTGQRLIAGLDVQPLVGVTRVVITPIHIHVYSTQSFGYLAKALEIYVYILVQIYRQVLLTGPCGERRSTQCEGGVYLLLAAPGYIHPEIPGDR